MQPHFKNVVNISIQNLDYKVPHVSDEIIHDYKFRPIAHLRLILSERIPTSSPAVAEKERSYGIVWNSRAAC